MGNNITVQVVRTLYGFTMDGLKMEKFNEGVINLAGVDIMSIVIIIS